MVNSTDRELLDSALGLISNVDAPAEGWPNQAQEWRDTARRWLDQYATVGGPAALPDSGPIGTRWRPIDKDAVVSPTPAPEPPDDPDEGETGPPETNA